jgi:hypothetical protein
MSFEHAAAHAKVVDSALGRLDASTHHLQKMRNQVHAAITRRTVVHTYAATRLTPAGQCSSLLCALIIAPTRHGNDT